MYVSVHLYWIYIFNGVYSVCSSLREINTGLNINYEDVSNKKIKNPALTHTHTHTHTHTKNTLVCFLELLAIGKVMM